MLPGKRYAFDDYLKIAWRHRALLIVVPLVITTLVSVFAARLPNRYRSETLILVVPQRVPSDYVKATVTESMQDRLPSISQQILSRTRLEQIIREFGLYADVRRTHPMELVVAQMRADIAVEIVKGESFRIAYEAADPLMAMKVTERLAAFFIDENLKDREVLASGTSAFLESQLEDARQRLVEHEKRLEEFRRTYNGELPSQLQSNLQMIQNQQLQLQSIREALSRDRDRKLLLERQLSEASADPVPVAATPAQNPDAADPAVQLETARNTLKALEVRLKPGHPDIVRLKRQIARLEASAAQAAIEPAPTPAASLPLVSAAVRSRTRELQLDIDNLARRLDSQQRQEHDLEASVSEYQRRVEAAPSRESQLVSLTRDYETLQNIYRTLLEKREDSKIAENLERRQIGEQFKVIDPARRPERPFRPDRLRLNGMGAAGGLALALALIALFEFLDKSLRTEQDVQLTLKLPVLAVVPPIVDPSSRRRRQIFTVARATAMMLVVAGCLAVLSQTLRGIR